MNHIGEKKLINQLTNKDAEDFKLFLMKKAPSGYKVYLRNIKAAFNKATDWEMIISNPFNKLKITKDQQVTPEFLSRGKLNVVLSKTDSRVIREIFLFGFYTGCRLSEIIYIRCGNVDLNKKVIIVGDREFSTKNKKSRLIPICQELLSLLKVRCNGTDEDQYVFTKGNGFPFNRDYVSRYFKKSVRKAGLGEQIHFHSLRHSFASNLALQNVPIIVIKELLGHSSIVTTQIYSHPDLDALKKAVGRFDE